MAGTPVWTNGGFVAVEKIRTGDMVLAQNPETGELAYKPVLRTTTRAAAPLVRIRADDGLLLVYNDGAWKPVESFPKAFWNLLKIVTVFTIAHSVSLVLAALGFIELPSRLVESVIALSIILVAFNNIFGKVRHGSQTRWLSARCKNGRRSVEHRISLAECGPSDSS